MNHAWKPTKLGLLLRKVARPVRLDPARTYKLLGAHWYAKGLYVKEEKKGSAIRAETLFQVEEGDFVYNRLFAWKGAFAVVTKDVSGCLVSGEFPSFTPNIDLVEPIFLLLYFSRVSAWNAALGLSTGSTPTSRNRLKESQFLNMEIQLPPLDKQRLIVFRIEELIARITQAKILRKQSDGETAIYFAKSLKRAFEPYSSKPKRIGEVFTVTTGGTPSRANPSFWGGDIKWVSSGEVAFCRITDTEEKITEAGSASSNAKMYPPGTVLIAMIGQGKTRGQCAILDCHATTNQNVAGIHVYKTPHTPEFVYWWLYSQYQESRFVETGTAQPALSGERVKQMPIPLPSPPEQAQTVSFLKNLAEKFDALKINQAEGAEELDALMPSILDKAFRGEL